MFSPTAEHTIHRAPSLFQIVLQFPAAAGVPKFTQSLGLNLADTLTGYIKLLPHLFKGTGAAIIQTKAQTQNLFLSGCQGTQYIHQLFLQQGKGLNGCLPLRRSASPTKPAPGRSS